MVKRLEHLSYEERLLRLELFNLEKKKMTNGGHDGGLVNYVRDGENG